MMPRNQRRRDTLWKSNWPTTEFAHRFVSWDRPRRRESGKMQCQRCGWSNNLKICRRELRVSRDGWGF